MAGFRGIGGKQGRLPTRKNYWQQVVTKWERIVCFAKSIGISVLTGWLFYRSIWSLFLIWPFAIWLYRNMVKEKIEKKKGEFLQQFKGMTESVAQALNVGYSAENAFKEAKEEMKILYPENSMIGTELDYIVRKLRLQIPLEQILEEFAKKIGLEDVKNFSTVFAAAKRNGGDMIAIIQNTASQISDKIDVKREIDIILASKKYEFRIMCVVPYIMILYMQISFPEFMGALYGNIVGIGVMTICLGIYAGACVLGARMIRIDV